MIKIIVYTHWYLPVEVLAVWMRQEASCTLYRQLQHKTEQIRNSKNCLLNFSISDSFRIF